MRFEGTNGRKSCQKCGCVYVERNLKKIIVGGKEILVCKHCFERMGK